MKYRWEQNYAKYCKPLKKKPLTLIRGQFPVFSKYPRICPLKVLQNVIFCVTPKNKNPCKYLIYRNFLVFALPLSGERGSLSPVLTAL